MENSPKKTTNIVESGKEEKEHHSFVNSHTEYKLDAWCEGK